jgi:hypothetical protein
MSAVKTNPRQSLACDDTSEMERRLVELSWTQGKVLGRKEGKSMAAWYGTERR